MNTKMNIQIGSFLNTEGISVEIIPNGPYKIIGSPSIIQYYIVTNSEGISVDYKEGKKFETSYEIYLCRCGLSKNKPYCDESHVNIKSKGLSLEETATFNESFATAQEIDGEIISLTDDEKLCAFARFCDNGKQIWEEVQGNSNEEINLSIDMAHKCPSGRLIIWDNKSKKPIENQTKPIIKLIEDPHINSSGPIVLEGGIPVKSSNGKFYEIRNRQTLCRCGMSDNKPFCNGAHASAKFNDGLMDD